MLLRQFVLQFVDLPTYYLSTNVLTVLYLPTYEDQLLYVVICFLISELETAKT